MNEIKSKILDLCSEDAYGSWELWWSISSEIRPGDNIDLRIQFMDTMDFLIKRKKIIPLLYRKEENKYENVIFERKKLENEIDHADSPDQSSFYWFDLVNSERDAGVRYIQPDGNGIVRVLPGNPKAKDLVKRGSYSRISGEQKVSDPIPLANNPVLKPKV